MPHSPYLALTLAVACVSCGSILVRFADAPALAVALYRTLFATLLLAPFSVGQARTAWPGLTLRQGLTLLGAGAALALHFASWIASLSLTSVAASTLLVNTTPLFSMGLGFLLLGERPSSGVVLATGLALAGMVVNVAGDASTGIAPLQGDLLALAGAFTGSLYHIAGRKLRAALPLQAYVLGVWSSTALALLALALSLDVPLIDLPPRAWLSFAGLALVPTLGGHGLINVALRQVPAPTVGLFLLGEPVGATLLAALFFQELPSFRIVVGGLIVLLALVLVARSER